MSNPTVCFICHAITFTPTIISCGPYDYPMPTCGALKCADQMKITSSSEAGPAESRGDQLYRAGLWRSWLDKIKGLEENRRQAFREKEAREYEVYLAGHWGGL